MIYTINFKLEIGDMTEQDFYRLIAEDAGYNESVKNVPKEERMSKIKFAKMILAKEASEKLTRAKKKEIEDTLKAQVDASLSVIKVVEQ